MRASSPVGGVVAVALHRDRDVAFAVEEPVDGFRAMATRDDDSGSAELLNSLRELLPIRIVRIRNAGEDACLLQVRGHHGGKQEEPLNEHGDGIVSQQLGARSRNHHWIDDKRHRVTLEKRGDGLDDRRAEQHPRLRGVDTDIGEEDLELSTDELRRRLVHRSHLGRRLRRERDDGAHSVAAESREGLQVGLDSGAAAGIGSRDSETSGNHC
jgi:hypothetical protein